MAPIVCLFNEVVPTSHFLQNNTKKTEKKSRWNDENVKNGEKGEIGRLVRPGVSEALDSQGLTPRRRPARFSFRSLSFLSKPQFPVWYRLGGILSKKTIFQTNEFWAFFFVGASSSWSGFYGWVVWWGYTVPGLFNIVSLQWPPTRYTDPLTYKLKMTLHRQHLFSPSRIEILIVD